MTMHVRVWLVQRRYAGERPFTISIYATPEGAEEAAQAIRERERGAVVTTAPWPLRGVTECNWRENADTVWETDCGRTWYYDAGGTPEEHGDHYCGKCGRPVAAHPYADDPEEETDDD